MKPLFMETATPMYTPAMTCHCSGLTLLFPYQR